MTSGRETPVRQNGSHEAELFLFPNGHSVAGEKDYLSPLAASLEAWKLRGGVIFRDIGYSVDIPALLSCEHQSSVPIYSSLKSNSQKPRNVRHCKKCVHFDDYNEFATSMEDDLEIFNTIVSHDALQEWSEKPWFYRPKPPSRRFSWRRLTIFSYPFCSWYGDKIEVHSERVAGIDALQVHSPPDADDVGFSVFCDFDCCDKEQEDPADYGASSTDSCPLILQDITNDSKLSKHSNFLPAAVDEVYGAPLSSSAVLSSHPTDAKQKGKDHPPSRDHLPQRNLDDKENSDALSAMQISPPSAVTVKNSPIDLQQAYQLQAFQEGRPHQGDGLSDDEEFELEDSDGCSPGEGSGSSNIEPPPETNDRQDVLLFHLDDQPIRSLVSWNSYEDMMHEIAHHFALQREDLVDAYEIVVPPPDIGIDVVPTIVHVLGDTHITGTDRLVLIDVEYHAHRCERNFRTGPDVLRSVKPLSQAASRNEVLFKANVDRYCRNEGGRCLVFINGRRWPDYDFDRKSIAHGDYIRIAVPPSDRYSCPTAAISDMTQRGLSDQQILDEIYTDDAASGFSPSPLNEEEVRGLAARQVEDTDEVPLMQWTLANHHSHDLRDGWCDTNNTSNESIPEDWCLDLQRLVQGQMQRGDGPYPQELMFSVYTWYIDLGDSYICREPRIAMLGDDPNEWREDILEPWRHQIRRGDGVLIDLVSPHAPRAEIEEHIAHIIITQRPNELNPALLSLGFVDTTSPSVIVRFAIAVSETCSPPQIEELVPLYHSFAGNRQEWINPLISVLQSFQTRPGINLIVRIFPHVDENEEESQDVSLIQQYIVSSHPDGAAFGSCSNCCDEDRKQSGLSSEQISRKQVKGPAGPFTDFSLTEEFIRYIQAVGTQAEAPPALLEPPDGLRDQPVWVQDLWEKWVETIQVPVGDVPHGPRLETWFTNPRRWTRCEHSRVVVLSSNFHQWERELLAAWHDRADIALPTQFAIVFPTPPDADRSVQEQVVIEQQSEPF